MYEKGYKYYADWRDRKGNRKRKSFDTPEEAVAFETVQKAESRPKTQGRAAKRSRRLSTDSPKVSMRGVKPRGLQTPSSESVATLRRRNSKSRTLTPSTGKSSRGYHLSLEPAMPRGSDVSSATYAPSIARKTSRLSSSARQLQGPEMLRSATPKGKRFSLSRDLPSSAGCSSAPTSQSDQGQRQSSVPPTTAVSAKPSPSPRSIKTLKNSQSPKASPKSSIAVTTSAPHSSPNSPSESVKHGKVGGLRP